MRFQFLAVAFLIFVGKESHGDRIYTKYDPVTVLDSSNFDQTILNQNHYWIVEFFNRWCGFCVKFANHWKEFARDVQNWKSVVKVAVLDCADTANAHLCKKHGITSFPSIRVFGLQTTTYEGLDVPVQHNSDFIRKQLIKALTVLWKDNVTPTWPHLLPMKAASLSELWQELPTNTNTVLLIVDSPSSYIGQEVILDLSGGRYPLLLTAVSNDSLANELRKLTDLSSLPALLKIDKTGEIKILAKKENNDENLREKFVHVIDPDKIIVKAITTTEPPFTIDIFKIIAKERRPVYMQDLENALNCSLRNEIGGHAMLDGDKLNAFKSYIKALKEYFPGREEVVRFFDKLYNWTMKHEKEINVDEMMKEMITMQTEEAFLPPKREWKGCLGSKSYLKGYSCSLWLLFHTLTAQALIKHREGAVDRPQDVVLVVRQYVKYFFSCIECSEHFQQMSSDLENELTNPEDGVLWLWRAHNKVNKRCASDPSTNDPISPKIQFPPEDLCSQCRRKETVSENILWNTPAVLNFLLKFYGKDEIVLESKNTLALWNSKETKISKAVVSNESSRFWKFEYFNGTDISLCVMLYLVSAMLLTIIYFLFTLRRQRYKMRYPNHFTVLP